MCGGVCFGMGIRSPAEGWERKVDKEAAGVDRARGRRVHGWCRGGDGDSGIRMSGMDNGQYSRRNVEMLLEGRYRGRDGWPQNWRNKDDWRQDLA